MTESMITLTELNQISQEAFMDKLGAIFEHTPQIAAQTWHDKPFKNIGALYQSMVAMVYRMSEEEKLSLILAHPDLGSKAKMALASVQEQAGVGLNQLTPEEYEIFQRYNQAYRAKFDFPFIIAVKNHTKTTILEAFASRIQNTREEEKQQALKEINQIAWFRLQSLLQDFS